jgi:hypothetical protein
MERKAMDAYLQHATLNLITMAIAAELARVSPAAKPPYLGKANRPLIVLPDLPIRACLESNL